MRILEIIGSVDPRDGGAVEGLLRQSSVRASRGLETHGADAVLFTTEAEMSRARNTFWPYRVRGRAVGYGTADIEGNPAMQKAAFRRTVPALADKPVPALSRRIHPKKGRDILVDAFARVASAHPGLDLVIAGPDQTGWRAAIEPAAQASGIAERIHWPGMWSGDAKWGAIRGCKAFVLPSH